MKFTSLISAVAISALLLFGCSSTESVIDYARASLVRVTTEQDTGMGVCTGFVVKREVVLTAAHCVGNLMQADGYEAKLIDEDDFFDLAALEVKRITKKPLHLRDNPVVEGEPVIALGYAWGWAFPLAQHVKVLIPAYRPSHHFAAGIVTQGGYYHGMSGGPVVDSFGAVVGVVQVTVEGAGFGVGVPVMKAFLFDAGVD